MRLDDGFLDQIVTEPRIVGEAAAVSSIVAELLLAANPAHYGGRYQHVHVSVSPSYCPLL